MGIRFFCQCGHRMNVKTFLAGKKGICPECGSKFVIPEKSDPRAKAGAAVADEPAPEAVADDEASTLVEDQLPPSDADNQSADRPDWSGEKLAVPTAPLPPTTSSRGAISEAGNAVWYVRHPDGGQYGPAEPTIMQRWLSEGRVGADSMVWHQGWADWKIAAEVFPELTTAGAGPSSGVEPGMAISPPSIESRLAGAEGERAADVALEDDLVVGPTDPSIALARKRELKRKRSIMMLSGLLVMAVSLCVVAAILLLR